MAEKTYEQEVESIWGTPSLGPKPVPTEIVSQDRREAEEAALRRCEACGRVRKADGKGILRRCVNYDGQWWHVFCHLRFHQRHP